jgi:hypothetical protein
MFAPLNRPIFGFLGCKKDVIQGKEVIDNGGGRQLWEEAAS